MNLKSFLRVYRRKLHKTVYIVKIKLEKFIVIFMEFVILEIRLDYLS